MDGDRLTVVAAVERDLAKIAELDPVLAGSGLAATTVALARELDKSGNSATSKAMCARALVVALDRLIELAPDEEKGGKLDDLTARREARLAGGAAA